MSERARARYPGAHPFAADRLSMKLFFGRERESVALTNQILANRLVVLFARSGLGKTSLLNAGVAERLRDERFLPLSVRLNDTKAGPVQSVYAKIDAECQRQGVEYVPGRRLSLWHFFKTAEFWGDDVLLTPVLILDQFEELFTLQSEDQRGTFLDQLSFLVRGVCPPVKAAGDYEETPVDDGSLSVLSDAPPPVRVVISLREDFLACLDEVADRLPQILDERYRLTPLTRETAAKAIEGPADVEDLALATHPFQIDEPTKATILDFLAQRAAGGTGRAGNSVEPFQLQLICQHIESAAAEKQKGRGARERVTVTLADIGGRAGLRRILKEFYKRQLLAVPGLVQRRRVGKLCSEHLITPQGRRVRMEETEIERLLRIKPSTLRALVDQRLLRADQSADGIYYELSHDSLIGPVLDSQRWKFKVRALGSMGVAILAVVLVVVLGLGAAGSVITALESSFRMWAWVISALLIVLAVVQGRSAVRTFRSAREMFRRSLIR